MTAADRVRGTAGSLASMLSSILSARHDMAARVRNVDLIAVLLALVLPWSTSGVGIAVVLWLVAVAAVLEPRPFLRSLQRPISALPIALVALAALGTLWSDASWAERLHAVSPAAKLLILPFLFYHFARSPRGMWPLVAFLVSCTVLMVVSWIVAFDPSLTLKRPRAGRARYLRQELHRPEPGIPVVRGRADFPHRHIVPRGQAQAGAAL